MKLHENKFICDCGCMLEEHVNLSKRWLVLMPTAAGRKPTAMGHDALHFADEGHLLAWAASRIVGELASRRETPTWCAAPGCDRSAQRFLTLYVPVDTAQPAVARQVVHDWCGGEACMGKLWDAASAVAGTSREKSV